MTILNDSAVVLEEKFTSFYDVTLFSPGTCDLSCFSVDKTTG